MLMSERLSLSQLFLEGRPDAAGAARLMDGELEAQLQAAFDRGRAAWPELPLGAEVFIRYLAQRAPSAPEMSGAASLPTSLRELHAEDLYLACACVQGASSSKGASEALSRRYIGQIPTQISHLRLAREEIEDICQTLAERLFIGRGDARPRIAEYSGRGPLLGWIRMAAIREALDRRRSQKAVVTEDDPQRGDGNRPDRTDASDPQLEYVKRRYRQQFEAALRTALSHLSAEQRNILRLHFLDGLSIDKLGALFKVHRATAARWVVAAQRALLADVRANLQEQLNVSPSEVDSIARLVRSQLHLSLPRLLLDAEGNKERGRV